MFFSRKAVAGAMGGLLDYEWAEFNLPAEMGACMPSSAGQLPERARNPGPSAPMQYLTNLKKFFD
jgi:hypothetical protein